LALFLVDQLSGVPLFDDLQAAEPITSERYHRLRGRSGFSPTSGRGGTGKKVVPIDDYIVQTS
jgi:hypothetical protein